MQHVRVGVGVLIWSPDGCLLLGQRLNAHGEGTWGPVGGHLEFGESFEACACRESFEETGLSLKNFSFVGITNDIFTTDDKHYVSIFLSTVLNDKPSLLPHETDKTQPWEWINLYNLPEKLFLPLRNFFQQTPPATLFEQIYSNKPDLPESGPSSQKLRRAV